jgi:hypothetical protein
MTGASLQLTGGCQCGAIRYAVHGEARDPLICHCRMCQKAFGAIAVAFFTVRETELEWTRGRPAHYRSSESANRGFCAQCGTPLTFRHIGRDEVDMALGSLDRPADVKPERQYYVEARMPWFAALPDLPVAASSAAAEEVARRRPYQHPDHDTAEWPPRGQRP